jgi:type IV pilus assembly protein PilC
MSRFSFSAQTTDGEVIHGHLEAVSQEIATEMIIKQGHRPISVTKVAGKTELLSFLKPKVKSSDLVIFTRQLSTMVSAGVPLLRALNTLTEQTENATFKDTLLSITKDIQSGTSLGDSFGKHPRVFSDVYVNMVRAGEAGGILDDILKRLAVQQEKNDSIKKKVKSAMTYPIILLIITIGAFFGLMLFVIPSIGKILLDLGGPDAELPMVTQVMLGISNFMVSRWYIILAATIIFVFGGRTYLRTPAGKKQLHYTIIHVPILGSVIKKVAIARFARTFSSLIGAGVSMLETLRVTGNSVGNEAFKDEINKGASAVTAGQQLSAALAKSSLFPGIVPQMLAVGEETGKTADILLKIADFYEEEVDATIASISSIIEPVMIVFMGGMVGLVAVSVMGPIASLSQNIQ